MAYKELKKAVALKYDTEKGSAPKVSAKGHGMVAETIIELAREEGIPISEDSDLVSSLVKLDLEDEVPRELYMAVAEILAFAYGLNKKMRK
ncbi:MAG: EscU/YscU/HrcU family type III secretion system export apparatus switch protein [Deltaproteobacteria bacterium]|nr:EscU/YscU/HrcU family type III secretion system export apparatus switch protein [Deltaproteobacteria bacterium]